MGLGGCVKQRGRGRIANGNYDELERKRVAFVVCSQLLNDKNRR